MDNERVLREAAFNPKVRLYWLLMGALIMLVTIVGIILIPFWFIIGHTITGRHLKRLSCVLTDRAVHVKKGLLNRVERTVPLDKITDVAFLQGPIMRALGLEALSIETAGQSSVGALLHVVGVVDARAFRDAVLRQRERFVERHGLDSSETRAIAGAESPAAINGNTTALLTEIRDSLQRIEKAIADKAAPRDF